MGMRAILDLLHDVVEASAPITGDGSDPFTRSQMDGAYQRLEDIQAPMRDRWFDVRGSSAPIDDGEASASSRRKRMTIVVRVLYILDQRDRQELETRIFEDAWTVEEAVCSPVESWTAAGIDTIFQAGTPQGAPIGDGSALLVSHPFTVLYRE